MVDDTHEVRPSPFPGDLFNNASGTGQQSLSNSLAFHVNPDRLLELFYDSFWPSLPVVLPLHHLAWRQAIEGHGMELLLLVMQYIGSIYAPWTSSEPYMEAALSALSSPSLAHTPFNVQALMLFAVAIYHSECKQEGQNKLDLATKNIGGGPYYFLLVADQHFAIHSNTPIFALASLPNTVDFPCDDEHFLSGIIPPVMTLQDYKDRELAELDITFSSIAYLYDLYRIVKSIIDEVMFTAHMIATIAVNGLHRPFSSLIMCPEEMTTVSFLPSVIFNTPPQQGRASHTARVLKASETHTKLLAIPSTIERHSVFTMYMVARLAMTQVSACRFLLEDRALSIARDRIRLSIGFLKAMGSLWSLGKMMASEVSYVARMNLSKPSSTITMAPERADVHLPRDELIWPVDPSAHIDIFSGLMLPIDWETTSCSYSSSNPWHRA
ncbi:hypothetical protein ACEQ8H_000980 [Pleosporales sp. CAS-2024a]